MVKGEGVTPLHDGQGRMAAAMESSMKIEKLGEDNHLTWFADVEQVLKIRDCWEAIQSDPSETVATALTGTTAIPSKADLTLTLTATDTTPEQKAEVRVLLRALEWRRKHEVAMAIMHLNVQPIHQATFRVSGSARAVWMQLQQTFRSRGLARAMEMRRQLASMQKTEREGMTEYLNRGSVLRYEMRQLGQEPNEMDLVAALLSGLPAEYETTVQLLEVLEITTLCGITDRLITAEVKLKRHVTNREAAALAAAQAYVDPTARGHPHPPYSDQRVCYGCGRTGHIRRDCPTHAHILPRGDASRAWDRGPHVHWGPPTPPRDDGHNGHGRGGAPPGGGLAMMAIGTTAEDADAQGSGQGHTEDAPLRRDENAGGANVAVGPTAEVHDSDPAAAELDERALVAVGTSALAATADDHAYQTDWIIDSGASHHMTGNRGALVDIRATNPVHITVVSGLTTIATTAGTAVADLDTDVGVTTTTLQDGLLAPGLAVNLFSIKAIMTHGCSAFFSDGGVTVNTTANVAFHVRARGYVLVLPLAHLAPGRGQVEDDGSAAAAVGIRAWHNRLAHPGREATLRTQSQVDGMEVTESSPRSALSELCEPYVLGKQTRGSFPTSTTRTTAAMDLLHMDLCGPLPVTSMGGANYLLGILDDTSGYAAAIPIRLKSQAGAAAAVTVKRWEAAVGRQAKMYRTDCGGEFVNRGMDRWASEEGLVHQTTAPYTPQQNGKAERFNRSLMEKVAAVMTAAKCDNALWAEAAATVVYAMNRTARAGQLLTPHEL